MKKSEWTTMIAVVSVNLCILGGVWCWDAWDYPMPGIPEAPPTPFATDAWDWNESVATNLSRVQATLRNHRYGRLREKWIHELKLADSYWTFRSGKFAVHFGGDGRFRVRKPAGQTPDKLEEFHSFERTGVNEIFLFSDSTGEGDSIRVSLSAINENSIMLVDPGGSPLAVIDRASSSSYFDRLEISVAVGKR